MSNVQNSTNRNDLCRALSCFQQVSEPSKSAEQTSKMLEYTLDALSELVPSDNLVVEDDFKQLMLLIVDIGSSLGITIHEQHQEGEDLARIHSALAQLVPAATRTSLLTSSVTADLLDLAAQQLRRVQKRYEKTSTTISNTISTTTSPGLQAETGNWTREALQQRKEWVETVESVVNALFGWLLVWPPPSDRNLARIMVEHASLLPALVAIYESPLLHASMASASSSAVHYRPVLLFKLRALEYVHELMERTFLAHQEDDGKDEDVQDGRLSLGDVFLLLLHESQSSMLDASSPSSTSRTTLENASLVADLEVLFQFADVVLPEYIQKYQKAEAVVDGEEMDRVQLEYVQASLRQLVSRVDSHLVREILSQEGSSNARTVAPILPSYETAVREKTTLDYATVSSLISQVRDLFPDYGEGFIEACLAHYDNQVETVIANLLEDHSLPENLAKLDRQHTQRLPPPDLLTSVSIPQQPQPPPSHQDSGLTERRNVYDGDEYDVYSGASLDPNLVSRGKRPPPDTRTLLDTRTHADFAHIKEAILHYSTNVTYDDDDEYDDTYEGEPSPLAEPLPNPATEDVTVGDMAGASKSAAPPRERPTPLPPTSGLSPEVTRILIELYLQSPSVLERNARKSKEREVLKTRLGGMSDEQVEGWKIMMDRNPRRETLLDRYRPGRALEENRNREQGMPTEHGSGSQGSQGRGGRGRGSRGSGRGGRGHRKNAHQRKLNRGMGGPSA